MGINVAIVISVSYYSGELASLPGCVVDGSAMNDLVSATKRYSQVLSLTSSEGSAIIKDRVSSFIEGIRDEAVDELLFYFTGHGSYYEDEFYYALSDYRSSRRQTTSLTNSELDGLIRSVNPALFIKIVDACQSGVAYIKGRDDLESFIKGRNNGFNRLYFMFSSSTQQSSYQSRQISDFTEALIESVASHQGDRIRYTDLISYVSDKFEGTSRQTPFFVTQADYTEVFCNVDDIVREAMKRHLSTGPSDLHAAQGKSGVVDRVRTKALEFGTAEDAAAALDCIKTAVETHQFRNELSDLYESVVSAPADYPPLSAEIGKWLSDLKAVEPVFAKSTTRKEEYQTRIPKTGEMSALLKLSTIYQTRDNDDLYKEVTRTRVVVTGYEETAGLTYKYVELNLLPLANSIGPERAYVSVLASRRSIFLFYRFVSFEYSGWSDVRIKHSTSWQFEESPLKDTGRIQEAVRRILADFEAQIFERLEASFPIPEDAPLAELSDPLSSSNPPPDAA
jgi:hypothetical protein